MRNHSPAFFTARLVLREPVEEDIPAIVEIAGDWEVASRLARIPHPYDEADARFFLSEIVPAEPTWVIVEQATRRVAGVIGLAPGGGGILQLGYYIARDRWGTGIATEAASAVVAHGIELVGRESLVASFFADNPASGRRLNCNDGFAVYGRASVRHFQDSHV